MSANTEARSKKKIIIKNIVIGVNTTACLCLETNFEASFPEKKSLPFNCFKKILQTAVRENIKAKNQIDIPKK